MITLQKPSDMEYADFVATRFKEAESASAPIVFTNRGSENARIVLRELVLRTTKSLDIFTGSLSAAVYDPAVIAGCARRLATAGKPVRILYSDGPPFPEASAIPLLREEVQRGAVLLRKLTEIDPTGRLNHFAISDGTNIRAESNHADRTATILLKADPEKVARPYADLFEKLWFRAVPHDVQAAA